MYRGDTSSGIRGKERKKKTAAERFTLESMRPIQKNENLLCLSPIKQVAHTHTLARFFTRSLFLSPPTTIHVCRVYELFLVVCVVYVLSTPLSESMHT